MSPGAGPSVPKTVWLWSERTSDDGAEVEQACRASWLTANPEWDVRRLGRDRWRRHAPKAAAGPRAGLDVRLEVLGRLGGVCVNATTWCRSPLDEWLPEACSTGFLVLTGEQSEPWLIAAAPGHPALSHWQKSGHPPEAQQQGDINERWRAVVAREVEAAEALNLTQEELDALPADRLSGLLARRPMLYRLDRISPRTPAPPLQVRVAGQAPELPADLRDELSRFASGGGRLLLHAGTPKTGSTGLQLALHGSRDALLAEGICYPSNVASQGPPKHQWLTLALFNRDMDQLSVHLRRSLTEATTAGSRVCILSTEGLYNHHEQYAAWAGPLMREIAAAVSLDLWVILRRPADFAAALYQQGLRNPPTGMFGNGEPLTPEQALALPSFRSKLDYDRFVTWWEDVLGADRVLCDVYVGDLREVTAARLGTHSVEWPGHRSNRSLSGTASRILVELNKISWPEGERRQAIDLVSELDRLVQKVAPREPVLGEGLRRAVEQVAAPSLRRLVARRPELSALLQAETRPTDVGD